MKAYFVSSETFSIKWKTLLLLPFPDLSPGGAVHTELGVGALHLEPPSEQVLHQVSITECCPIPDTV